MAAVLDQMVTVGEEAAYGSPSVGTRGVLSRSDGWEDEVQEVSADGARAGRQAMLPGQTVHVPTGGSGRIEAPLTVDGMSLLIRHLMGASAEDDVADTAGHAHSAVSAAGGPASSYTFWVRRVASDGAKHSTVYSGCVVTGWSLECASGDAASLMIDYDWASQTTAVGESPAGEPTPVYPSGRAYTWRDLRVLAGQVVLGTVKSFSFQCDNSLDTDRRYLRGSAVKAMPVRSGVPAYTGSLTCDLDATTGGLVDAWRGGLVRTLVVEWTADDLNIATDPNSDTVRPSVRLTLPSLKFTGSAPQMSLDGLTEVTLPFSVFQPPSGDAVTLRVVSDAAAWS